MSSRARPEPKSQTREAPNSFSAFCYRNLPRLTFHWRKLVRANWEPEMKLLDILCDQRRTSVDIGAKVGMYTYRLARQSKSVIAFEPIPKFNKMLQTVLGGRVRVEPLALSDEAGEAILRMPFEPSGKPVYGRSTIEQTNDLAHGEIGLVDEIIVEVRTLDSYELTDVGLIKIDVEGHEMAVLRGAAETVGRCRPNFLIEANDNHRKNAVADVRDWLADHGYVGCFVDDGVVVDAAEFSLEEHFETRYCENFMFFHQSNLDRRERVVERIENRRRRGLKQSQKVSTR